MSLVMSYSVQEFLTFLKLEEYLPNFINNDITELRHVNENLLINIGVDKVGHRRRFLKELETLLGSSMYTTEGNNAFSNQQDDDDDDDEPPPLPPKQKKLHNSRETSPGNFKESQPGKQTPKKPPRTTLPPRPNHAPPPIPQRGDLTKDIDIPVVIEEKLVKTRSLEHLVDDDSLQNTERLDKSEEKKEQMLKRYTMTSFDSFQAMRSAIAADKNRIGSLRGQTLGLDRFDASKNNGVMRPRHDTDNAMGLRNKSKHHGVTSLPKVTSSTNNGLNGIPAPIIKKDELLNVATHLHTPDEKLNSNRRNRNISFGDDLIDLSNNVHEASATDSVPVTKNNDSVDLIESPSKDIAQGGFNSADELSDDDDTIKDLEGTQITLMKHKAELMDIVAHKKPSGDKSINRNDVTRSLSAKRKSRFFQAKSGYLFMRGEGRGKRWVEFTGSEINVFKDKNGILRLTIPVLKISDVIWERGAKKPTFHIVTKSKEYTFTEPSGDHNALTIWANVILEGVMGKGSEGDGDNYSPGGEMANPDIEGYLLKEGHSILHEIRKRYVVIKENKLCYYNTKEEFENDMDFLSCLEMALVSLKCDDDKLRLILHTHTNKTYTFGAEDIAQFNSWKEAIETSIQYGIGDDTIKNQIQENESNMKCADCGENNPIYASINLLVVTCSKCTGFHREMGCHISKARSLLMDKYIWTPALIKLFQTVGNERANSIWAHKLPTDDCIVPRSSKEDRELFIFSKYKERKYFNWSPFYGQPKELGEELRKIVVTDNVLETLRLLISEADIYYVPEGCQDQRTPYELAKDAGMELQVELLHHFNGHLTKEERLELEQQKSAMQQTTGILQVKTTRSDALKERQCTLNGKKIEMKKLDKFEESEIIDLTKLEDMEIDSEDMTTLILKFPERTYFLKAYLPEDINTWYRAIHNKQVFGVPVENQEYNDKKIPYTIAECINFMEQHSLMTEGVYRLSGSQLTIKKLTLLFNQDAKNLRLSIDDFPDVHAVAGLIKLYFRLLPDPLLTKNLYEEWIRNAEETVTEEGRIQKLYRYKSLLQELPPCNYTILRFLILHLSQVVSLSDFNKMALANVIVIFGPILASCGNTVDQAWLKREYNILSDMLTYYQWLFEVSEVELKVLQGMTNFHLSTQQNKQQPLVTDSSTMVTIFVGSVEDQMKMTNTTKSSEVCLFCIKKHTLSVNTNWGLFETTVEGDMERLVHSSELVLKLAESMGVKRKLVVKCNDVTDLISAHRSTSLCISGYLHFNNKGSNWRKNCYVELKTGNLKIYKQKGANKEEENLPIHEIELFIGSNAKKKPPAEFGFVLSKTRDGEFRHFCSDDEMEVNKFIANILVVRYPSGMWSPISEKTEDESGLGDVSLDDPSWGRQSAFVRPSGTSNRLLSQLDKKKQTLKNIFK